MEQLKKEQGDLSVYHEKQAKINSQKAELEVSLVEAQNKLVVMESNRQAATADKKLLEGETVAIKKDMEDIAMAIQKLEQEKTNRDHTIHSLNDEIAGQDEVLNKLNKEKKHSSDTASKSAEDLQVAEEKVEHLTKIKSKLESTLDELESSLDREKRQELRLRKLEGRLKVI